MPEPLPDNYDQVPADKKLVRKLQRKRNRLFKWKHTLGYPGGTAKVHDGVFEAVPSDAADEENFFWLSQNVPSCPTNFGEFPPPCSPMTFRMIRLEGGDTRRLIHCVSHRCGGKEPHEQRGGGAHTSIFL